MPGKIRGLFRWCLKVTEGYVGVELLDMTSSWKDGLAFCAIINRFRPDLIDFYSLSPDNVYYNNDLAFSVMEKEYSITRLLDASDMVEMESPDRYSIATYVSSFYEVFNDKPMHDPPPVPENWTAKKSAPKHKQDELDKLSEVTQKQKLEKNSATNCDIVSDSKQTSSDVNTNESQDLQTNDTSMKDQDTSPSVKTETQPDEHDDSDIDELFVRSRSVLEEENDIDSLVNMHSYKDLCQESIDDIRNSKQNVVLQAVVLAGVTAVAATTVGEENDNFVEDNLDNVIQSEDRADNLEETFDKHKENVSDIMCNAPSKTMDFEHVDSFEEFDRQDDSLTDSGCFTNTVLNTLDLDSVDPNSTLKSEMEELIPDTDKTFDTSISVTSGCVVPSEKKDGIKTEQPDQCSSIKDSNFKTSLTDLEFPDNVEKLGKEPFSIQMPSFQTKDDEQVVETCSKEQLCENQPQDISITKETVDVLNIELNKGEIQIEDVVVVSQEDESVLDNNNDTSVERAIEAKIVSEEKMQESDYGALYDDNVKTTGNADIEDLNQMHQEDDLEQNQNRNETEMADEATFICIPEQKQSNTQVEQQMYATEAVYDEIVDVIDNTTYKDNDMNKLDPQNDHEQNPSKTVTDNSVEETNPQQKDTSPGFQLQSKTEETSYVNEVDTSEKSEVLENGVSSTAKVDDNALNYRLDIDMSVEPILITNTEQKDIISKPEQRTCADDKVYGDKDALYDKVDITENAEIGNDTKPTYKVDAIDQVHHKTDHSDEAILVVGPENKDPKSEIIQDVAEEIVYDKVETTNKKEITLHDDKTDKGDSNDQNGDKIDTGKSVESNSLPNPSKTGKVTEDVRDNNSEKTEIIEDEYKPEVNIVDNSKVINGNFEKDTENEPCETNAEQTFAECIATDIVNNMFEQMKSHPNMLDPEMDIQAIVNEIQVDLEVEKASQDTTESNFDMFQPGNKMISAEEEKDLDIDLAVNDGPTKTNESIESSENAKDLTRKLSTSSDSCDTMSGKDSPPPALPTIGPPDLIKADRHDHESFEDFIVESSHKQVLNAPPKLISGTEDIHTYGLQEEHVRNLGSNQLIEENSIVLQKVSNNEEGQEKIEMSNGINDQNEREIVFTPCTQTNGNQDLESLKTYEEKRIESPETGTSEIKDRSEIEPSALNDGETDKEISPSQLQDDSNVQCKSKPVESYTYIMEQTGTESPSTSDNSLHEQDENVESLASPVYYEADISSAVPLFHDGANIKEVRDAILVNDDVSSIECEFIYPSCENKVESNIDALKTNIGGQNRFYEAKENTIDIVFQTLKKDGPQPSSSEVSKEPFYEKNEANKEDQVTVDEKDTSLLIESMKEIVAYDDKSNPTDCSAMKTTVEGDDLLTSRNNDPDILTQSDSKKTHMDLETSDKEWQGMLTDPRLDEVKLNSNLSLSFEKEKTGDSVISSPSDECVHENRTLPLDEEVKEKTADTNSTDNKTQGKEKDAGLLNGDEDDNSIDISKLRLPDKVIDQTDDLATDGKDSGTAVKEELSSSEVKAVSVKRGEVKLDWSTRLSDPNGNIAKEVSLQFSAPISAEGDETEFPEANIKEKSFADIDKDLLKRAAIMSRRMAEKVTMRILNDQRQDLGDKNGLDKNREGKDFETPGTPPPTPDISHETAKERRQAMFQILQNSTRPTKKKFVEEEDLKNDEKNLDFASKMKLWNRRSFTSSDLSRKSATDVVPKKRISLTSPFLSSDNTVPEMKDTHLAKLTKILPDKPAPGSVAEYVRKISERKSPTLEEKSKRFSRSDSDTGSDKSFDGKEKFSRNIWRDIAEDNDSSEREKTQTDNEEQNITNKIITPSAIFSQRPFVKMRSKNNNVKVPIRPLSLEAKYEEENKDSSKPPLPPLRASRKSLGKVNVNIKPIDKKAEENNISEGNEEKEAVLRQDSLKKRNSPKRSLSLSSPTRSRSSSGERERNVWIDQSTKPPSPNLKRNDSFEVKIRPVISQKSPEEKYTDRKEKELKTEASLSTAAYPTTQPKTLSKVEVSVLPVSAQEDDGQESSPTEKPVKGGRRSLLSLIGSIKKPKEKENPKEDKESLIGIGVSKNVQDTKVTDQKNEEKATSKLYDVVKRVVEKEQSDVPEYCSELTHKHSEEQTNPQEVEEEIVLQVNTPVQSSVNLKVDESDGNNDYHHEKESTIKKCNSIFSSAKPKMTSENKQISNDQLNDNVEDTADFPTDLVNRKLYDLIKHDDKENLPVKENNQIIEKIESSNSISSSEDVDKQSSGNNSSAEINRLDLKEGLVAIIKDIEKEIDTQHGNETVDVETGPEEDDLIYVPCDPLLIKHENKCDRDSSHIPISAENQIVFKVTLNDKQIDPKCENSGQPVRDTKVRAPVNKDQFDEIKTFKADDNKKFNLKKNKRKKKKEKCSDSSSESSQPDTDESDKDESLKEENGQQKKCYSNAQSFSGNNKKEERKVSQGSEKSSKSSESQESDIKDENYLIETELEMNICNEKEIFASIDVGLKDNGLFIQDSVESTDFPDDIIQVTCDKDYVLIEKKQDYLDTNESSIDSNSMDTQNLTKSIEVEANDCKVDLDMDKRQKIDHVSADLPDTDTVFNLEEEEKGQKKHLDKYPIYENTIKIEKPDILHNLPKRDSTLVSSFESDSDSSSSSIDQNSKTDKKRKRKHRKGRSGSDSSNFDSDLDKNKDMIKNTFNDSAKGKDQLSVGCDSDRTDIGSVGTTKILPNDDKNLYEPLTDKLCDPHFNPKIYDQLVEPLPDRELMKAEYDAETHSALDEQSKSKKVTVKDIDEVDLTEQSVISNERLASTSSSSSSSSDLEDEDKTNISNQHISCEKSINAMEVQTPSRVVFLERNQECISDKDDVPSVTEASNVYKDDNGLSTKTIAYPKSGKTMNVVLDNLPTEENLKNDHPIQPQPDDHPIKIGHESPNEKEINIGEKRSLKSSSSSDSDIDDENKIIDQHKLYEDLIQPKGDDGIIYFQIEQKSEPKKIERNVKDRPSTSSYLSESDIEDGNKSMMTYQTQVYEDGLEKMGKVESVNLEESDKKPIREDNNQHSSPSTKSVYETVVTKENSSEGEPELDQITYNLPSRDIMIDDVQTQIKDDDKAIQMRYDLDSAREIETIDTDTKEKRCSISSSSSSDSNIEDTNDLITNNLLNLYEDLIQPKGDDSNIQELFRPDHSEETKIKKIDEKNRKSSISSTSSSNSSEDDDIILSDVEEICPQYFQVVQVALPTDVGEKPELGVSVQGHVNVTIDQLDADKSEDGEKVTSPLPYLELKMKDSNNLVEELEESSNTPWKFIENDCSMQESANKVLVDNDSKEILRQTSELSPGTSNESDQDITEIEKSEKEIEDEHAEEGRSRHTSKSSTSYESAQEEINTMQIEDHEDDLLKIVIEDSQPFKAPLLETVVTSDTESNETGNDKVTLTKTNSSDDLYTNDKKDVEEKIYLLPECNMIKTEYNEMNIKGSEIPYNILDFDYKPEPIDIQVFVIPDRTIDKPLLQNLESPETKDIVLVDNDLHKAEPSVVMSFDSLHDIQNREQIFYNDLNADDYLVPRELRDIILEPVSHDMSVSSGGVEDADVEDYLLQNIIQKQAKVPVVRRKKSSSSSSSSSEDVIVERDYENTDLEDEHVYQTVDYDDLANDNDTEQYEDGEIYEDIVDDDVKDSHEIKNDYSLSNVCSGDKKSYTDIESDRDLYKTGDNSLVIESQMDNFNDVSNTKLVEDKKTDDISCVRESQIDIVTNVNDIEVVEDHNTGDILCVKESQTDGVNELNKVTEDVTDTFKDLSESSSSSSSSDRSDDEDTDKKDFELNLVCENIDTELFQKQLSDYIDETPTVLAKTLTVPTKMTLEESIEPDNIELNESVPDDVIVEESFITDDVTLNKSVVPDGVIVTEFLVPNNVTLIESVTPDNGLIANSSVPSNISIEQSIGSSNVTFEKSFKPDKINFEVLDLQESITHEDSIVPDSETPEENIPDKRIFGELQTTDGQQLEKETNFMIGREKDPSKSEVARLIQQSLELDRKREELRRQEQERLQDSIQPRDEVLEKEHHKHLHDPHEQLEREEENVDLDESSLEDEVDAEEKEISEGQFSEEYQAGEATPMSMPSGVDTDNSVSSPEEGDGKPVVEVFDLQESSSEDISPDMESQALFVKLKEAQLRIAVLEAELAKLKARLIVLENTETQKKQLEKKNEEMAARLRETEKSLTNTRKEINHYQDLLEGSQGQYIKLEKKMSGDFTALEKKYHKAKKLIKEYQQREKDFVAERESLLQQQTEKDQQYNALVKSLKDKIFLLEGDLREAQKAAGLPVLSQSQEPMGVKSEPIVTPVSVQTVRSAPLVHDSGSPLMSPVGDKDSMSSESETSSADVINTDSEIKATKVDLFESMPVTEPLDTSVHRAKAQVANNSRRPPTKQRSKSQDSDEMMESASNKDESGLETWIKHDSDNTVKKSDVRKRKAQQQGSDPQSPPTETADTGSSEVKVNIIEPLTSEDKLPTPPPPPSDPPASLPDIDPVAPARERGDSESNDSSSTVSQSSYDPSKPNFRSKESEIPGLDTGSVDLPESQETESESSSISAKKSKGFNLPKLPFKFGGNERDKGGVMLISSRSINTGDEPTSNEGGITLISKRKLDTGIDFDGASTISTVSDTSSGYMVGEQESTSYSFSGTPASEDHPSHPTAHIQNQFQASPIAEWNTEHVQTWLIGIEMDKYIQLFAEKSINGLQLVNLDANKLKAMGISNSKDRDILKKKVKELKLVLEKERKQLEKERKQMEKEQKAKEKEQKKLSKKK